MLLLVIDFLINFGKEFCLMNLNLPNDPVMLLSYVNTQLRDYYPSLEEFCKSAGAEQPVLVGKLAAINYQYEESRNQFV